MILDPLLKTHREEILKIADRYGVHHVRIFGSTARGESGDESDIDVLVELEPGRSLFDLGGFQIELQELLGFHVDVVTETGLHWYIRERVLEEAVPL